MKINICKDIEFIKAILEDSGLSEVIDCSYSKEVFGFSVDPNSSYLLVQKGEEILAIAKFSLMTEVCIEYHLYILPSHWGKSYSDDIKTIVEEWFYNNTSASSIVIFSPESCKEVHKAAIRVGYEPTGIIPFGVIWNNRAESLLMFTKIIWRS